LSEELNLLLQRIHPTVEPQQPTEPSDNLLLLMRRVENRRWQQEEIARTEERLKEAQEEVKFIRHALKCHQCQVEIQLDIERYGGRMCPWYLSIEYWDLLDLDEDEMPEYLKGCPRPRDYKIGSYWTGSSEDTIRFIKDRLRWAEKIMKKEVKAIRNYLRALKKWDLESPLPPDTYFTF